MGSELNLLRSLPATRRDVSARARDKSADVIDRARKYGRDYFDGDRKYGYGGYHYDGRWRAVARDVLAHYFPDGVDTMYRDVARPRVLDVGCAKGFLVSDLCDAGADAYGLDVSWYAVRGCPHPSVVGRLHRGHAVGLPFPDDSFDLVLSINTLHNLRPGPLRAALGEITRVSRGSAFVQVDSYRTETEKALFRDWVITAQTHGRPEHWLELFAEAGYVGDYGWTIVETGVDG